MRFVLYVSTRIGEIGDEIAPSALLRVSATAARKSLMSRHRWIASAHDPLEPHRVLHSRLQRNQERSVHAGPFDPVAADQPLDTGRFCCSRGGVEPRSGAGMPALGGISLGESRPNS